MIVKVCGMGDTVRMHQLATLPVDMLGFIFYPKSPRYVVGKIDPVEISKLPNYIHRVGVFVNATSEEIHEMAERYFLTSIQLHGNESPELCRELKAEGYTILKAFNISKENDYEAYSPFCDYFLFDTPSVQHGGTGQKFDWTLLENYKGSVPFLLSGGIGPYDADAITQIDHPLFAGIDINSKFEIEPGIKDVELIKKFLKQPHQPPNPLKGGQRNYEIDSSIHFLNETKPTYNDNSNDDLRTGKNMFYGAEPILFEFAKRNRLNPTEAEEFLWNQLSADKLKGVRFKRQHPTLYFIADFYCHQAKLIIEVDGGYHKIPSQYEYDCNRDKDLEELGLKVIRFTNEEVLSDIENVLKRIEHEIHPQTP